MDFNKDVIYLFLFLPLRAFFSFVCFRMRSLLRPYGLKYGGNGLFSFRLASSSPNVKADLERMRNIGISGESVCFS